MRLKRGVVVLHRGPGITQVGLARPVVIAGLSRRDQAALAVLEGGRLATDSLSSAARAGLARVIAAGHERAPGEAGSPGRTFTVAMHGAGAIGIAAARSLAKHGHSVEFVDTAPAVTESPGVFASPRPRDTCAMAAARDVLAAVPWASVRVGASAPDAAIAVGVGAADPVAWLPLLRADVPHVLVATDEVGVDVGPLVVPGASACAHCLDIAKTAADAEWPLVRLQCGSSRRPVTAPLVAEQAGSLAAAMLIALLDGSPSGANSEHRAASWAVNAIWRIEPGRPPTATPVWPQPECGCGATGFPATSAMISAP